MSIAPTLELEQQLLAQHPLVIALDEVGRGALAGPVAVGGVLLDAAAGTIPEGLRDSKLVPEARRAELAVRAAAWVRFSAVGWASAEEVDEHGIMRALGLAASRVVLALGEADAETDAAVVVLDGNHDYLSRVHPHRLVVRTVVKGDRDCASISAASVIAKVARDDLMCRAHDEHPVYGWDRNKGYASAAHRAAIRAYGLSPLHRASWAIADAPALF